MSANDLRFSCSNGTICAEDIDKTIDILYKQAMDTLPVDLLKTLRENHAGDGSRYRLSPRKVKDNPKPAKKAMSKSNSQKLRMKTPTPSSSSSSASIRRQKSVVDRSMNSSIPVKLVRTKSMDDIDNLETFETLGVQSRAKFWEKIAQQNNNEE